MCVTTRSNNTNQTNLDAVIVAQFGERVRTAITNFHTTRRLLFDYLKALENSVSEGSPNDRLTIAAALEEAAKEIITYHRENDTGSAEAITNCKSAIQQGRTLYEQLERTVQLRLERQATNNAYEDDGVNEALDRLKQQLYLAFPNNCLQTLGQAVLQRAKVLRKTAQLRQAKEKEEKLRQESAQLRQEDALGQEKNAQLRQENALLRQKYKDVLQMEMADLRAFEASFPAVRVSQAGWSTEDDVTEQFADFSRKMKTAGESLDELLGRSIEFDVEKLSDFTRTQLQWLTQKRKDLLAHLVRLGIDPGPEAMKVSAAEADKESHPDSSGPVGN